MSTDRLTQMLAGLETEVRDKLAQVKAAEVRLAALQSAHRDLEDQTAKAHAKLATANSKVDRVAAACEAMLTTAYEGATEMLGRAVAAADRLAKLAA